MDDMHILNEISTEDYHGMMKRKGGLLTIAESGNLLVYSSETDVLAIWHAVQHHER